MEEKTRLEARELLLRSRLYRFAALIFAIVGIILFLFLYFKYIEGDMYQALQNPKLVLILLIPFLPAFILSRMAIKTEGKFQKIMDEQEDIVSKDVNETSSD